MKRVEGVVYLYCCEKWHERWNDKLMTRWMPRHLFFTENALCCLLCEEMRRQLLPRRHKRHAKAFSVKNRCLGIHLVISLSFHLSCHFSQQYKYVTPSTLFMIYIVR